MKKSLNDLVQTRVIIRSLDKYGAEVSRTVRKNQITKEGVSILARLLADPSGSRPSHVYGRFATSLGDATGTTNFSAPSTMVDAGHGDFIADAGSGVGCMREPLFAAVKIEANDDIIDGKLTFFFRLSSASIAGSVTNASEVFFLGLAAASQTDIPSQDSIFSVLISHDGTNGVELPDSGQIAIDYELTFTA
jgi:hypothetical protein